MPASTISSAARIPEVCVLWNASARATRDFPDLRADVGSRPGIAVIDSASRRDVQCAARRAAEAGARRVIAAGGDGTVNAVANGLLAAGAPGVELAVLPLGTGNDLARTLGMPLDPFEAYEVCLAGEVRPMDVGAVRTSGRPMHFLNMATGGNTGRYAAHLTHEVKQFWGPFAYLRGAIDLLADLVVYDLEADFDDSGPERCAVLNVFVANGRSSGGGLVVAPTARIDDGLLDVVLVRDGSPLQIASLGADFVKTSFLANDLIVHRRAKRLTLRAAPPIPFSADGDVVGEGALTFSVREQALRVVAHSHDA